MIMTNIFRHGKNWYPMKSGESTVTDMLELKVDKPATVSHNGSHNNGSINNYNFISFIFK